MTLTQEVYFIRRCAFAAFGRGAVHVVSGGVSDWRPLKAVAAIACGDGQQGGG